MRPTLRATCPDIFINAARILSIALLFAAGVSERTADARALSPTWQQLRDGDAAQVFKVAQYIEPAKPTESATVLIASGSEEGIVAGNVFKTFRSSLGTAGSAITEPVWVETGRLKALEVQDHVTIATVENQGSNLSHLLLPKFPGVMAGDFVIADRMAISRKQALMPTIDLSYQELFVDPTANPGNFELSPEGAQKLKEVAETFAGVHMKMLMIEGYTDHHGPADANQIESYQRAQSVRQMLVDSLGFDEKRVVAIGYGEGEPKDGSLTPGYIETNRHIVLKVVPLPN